LTSTDRSQLIAHADILVGIQAQPPWVGQPSSPLDLLATAALVRHSTMEADACTAKGWGKTHVPGFVPRLFPVGTRLNPQIGFISADLQAIR
jgi:hypothetical protein